MAPPTDLLRVYELPEIGADGYPLAWRLGVDGIRIPDVVREIAGHRCIRCGHPYRTGQSNPEWSPCDESCNHPGPIRLVSRGKGTPVLVERKDIDSRQARGAAAATFFQFDPIIEAQYRVLTVHHLTGEKADCRWFNLMAACQRCHLVIQGKVRMNRPWPWPHSDWMKPYAAGYYAATYLGEDLSREEVAERQDDLLALELAA